MLTKAQRRVLEAMVPEGAHLDQAGFKVSRRRYDFMWVVRVNPHDNIGTVTVRKDTVAALLRAGWVAPCAHKGSWTITDAGRAALTRP